MMAISYFAKDLPRLLQNKKDQNWEKYSIEEIRGKTLGIVGYGDIGRSAARLAKAYGMNIIALRRKPPKEGNVKDDPLCDQVYFGTGDDAEDRKERGESRRGRIDSGNRDRYGLPGGSGISPQQEGPRHPHRDVH